MIEFEVACSPGHAFDTWANRTSLWWPRSHSMTSAPGLMVTFEPRPGGRIFERTPTGVEHDWGEVLAWEPPRRLAYLWHLGTDRGRATEVDISFAGDADATTVTIVHRGWERLGRILRPKADGGRARFYTVVSRDTNDTEYAQRRQRFLAEQGYAYRIVDADDLPGPAVPDTD